MLATLLELLETKETRAVALLFGSIICALVVEFVLARVIARLVGKTRNNLDDEVIEALRRPTFLSVILIGIWAALLTLEPSERLLNPARAGLISIAVLFWMLTLLGISRTILSALSARATASGRRTIVHPRTIPVFDMLLKIAVIAAATYAALLAWRVDPTAWLASAGILGIAIGFAAKDSLANLFAGIFIIADSPYKIGDIIVLDGVTRGRVTAIGIRSTRILTLDDVEITIPNSTMGNAMIHNEVGGPAPKQRLKVGVSVAYGSDIDKVREVLLSCSENEDLIASSPAPSTRFTTFGASGLDFQLLVWIDDASRKDELVDRLNDRIYKALGAADIEIPYAKHDVYIKTMPRS